MSKMHNKKRNVGIIYEQLILYMCNKMLENKNDDVKRASKVIKKYFSKNTQLFKEYKLFKALVNTRGIDSVLATSIIQEAKKACTDHFHENNLESEKSNLIFELNKNFGKGNIFKEKVKNYKTYATIQTLINEWRSGVHCDFETVSQYEIKLHEWMTSKPKDLNESNKYKHIDPLTFKLMEEKFNTKYSNKLNDIQRKIIKEFVESNNIENTKEIFYKVKNNTLSKLFEFRKNCSNSILNEKYSKVYKNIQELDETIVNEENLQKFLTCATLNEELEEKSK